LKLRLTPEKLNFRRINMPNQKWKPGENCPEAGEYQLMNSNGQGTGNYVTMEKGHRFPPTDKEGQYYSK
jgi:hypothetical protein